MAISEAKMQMVIANYFKDECDVNTSIRQAFEKGFRIGVKKGASTNRPQGEWIEHWYPHFDLAGIECSICGKDVPYWERNYDMPNFCPNCGADMRGDNDYERAIEQMEHDMLYEPTYNSEDGSM